ncbi:HAD family hydrolase [Kribbella swartbergensis]
MSALIEADDLVLPPRLAGGVRVLLCDADGNLFPSEEPAFAASARVTNELLETLGIDRGWTGEELRRATTGVTFRRTAAALAAEYGVHEIAGLEQWVEREKQVVTTHLAATLRRDREVLEPLGLLAAHLGLAAVSSSALDRLSACFVATGLDELFPPDRVFSAEDSLRTPTSKPDPAIYRHACARLGVGPGQALAVEDSIAGVRSAVAAGCRTVGNVQFVPPGEKTDRAAQLAGSGAVGVVASWAELADALMPALAARGPTRREA